MIKSIKLCDEDGTVISSIDVGDYDLSKPLAKADLLNEIMLVIDEEKEN